MKTLVGVGVGLVEAVKGWCVGDNKLKGVSEDVLCY